VSGITIEIATDAQGQIKDLQVKMEDGSRFNLQRTYKVVMNSYIAAVSQYEKADPGESLYITSAAMTIQYLEKQPAVDYKGVKRIRIKN
jgi:5'-nucleotidase